MSALAKPDDGQQRATLAAFHLGNGWRAVEQHDGRWCALKGRVRVYPHGRGYHAEFEGVGGWRASATATIATGACLALAVVVRQYIARAEEALQEVGL